MDIADEIHRATYLRTLGEEDLAAEQVRGLLVASLHELDVYLPALVEAGFATTCEDWLRRASQRATDRASYIHRLLQLQLLTGRPEACLAEIEACTPDSADPYELALYAGHAQKQLQQIDLALEKFMHAAKLEPKRFEAWSELASISLQHQQFERALEHFQRALTSTIPTTPSPEQVGEVLIGIAQACFRLNRTESAWAFLKKATTLSGYSEGLNWISASIAPIIYTSTDQIHDAEAHYWRSLDHIRQSCATMTPSDAIQALEHISPPFYLHYAGGNQVDHMRAFGQCVEQVTAPIRANLHPFREPPGQTQRIRVGFLSYFWSDHTVTKLFGQWPTHLDPEQFDVHVIHIGPTCDALTARVVGETTTFHHWPVVSPLQIAQGSRKLELDYALFPELGMFAPLYVAASLGCAPKQGVAWGHPVTTGLVNMDFALSSHEMEPPNGQEHYTETLVRLPGLGASPMPTYVQPSHKDRKAFGLPDSATLILVPQSLFKLLPQHDRVFAEILHRLPDAMLLFIAHATPAVTGAFIARLQAACVQRGSDATRIHVLPRMSTEDYLALNSVSDLFLDGLSWSGGVTTLEAIAMGLVPVTCPGDTMRARHTAAILRLLEQEGLIASTPNALVDRVVELAGDPDLRASISRKLSTAAKVIYEDQTIVHHLQDHIRRAVFSDSP